MFLDRGGEYLQSPHCRKQVLKLLEEGHEYLCRQEVPLKEVLPQAVLDIVDQWPRGLAQVIPELVDRLRDSKEVTVRLTAVILEQMELMKERGTLAWIGIGLYQYFNEYEEEIWRFVRQDIFPRLSEFLASPEIKGWMERSIREQSEAILSRPIGELAGGIKGEQLAQTGDWLADRLVNWLNGDDARVWVESFLLDRYQDLADKRVIDICAKYLNLKPEEVEGGLTTYGIGLLNSPAAARLLESVANSLVDRAGDYPIGRLGDRFSKETLVKVEKKATALVTGYLKEKIPTFWGHMDIQAIVKGRISDYSSRELVVMFQKVTMNSLYRIEIYGGVIGAFMGLFFGLANMRTDAFWLVAAVLAALAVLLYFAKK